MWKFLARKKVSICKNINVLFPLKKGVLSHLKLHPYTDIQTVPSLGDEVTSDFSPSPPLHYTIFCNDHLNYLYSIWEV